MNHECQIRTKEAERVVERVGKLSMGILMIGSTAYCPDGVSDASDVDLDLIVENLAEANIPEIYRGLDQPIDDAVLQYVSRRKIDNFRIYWIKNGFETNVFIWDKQAFENLVGLHHYVRLFRKSGHISKPEILVNLHGGVLNSEAEDYPNHKTQVDGGFIVVVHPYFEKDHEIYLNAHSAYMLTSPKPMYQHENYLSHAIHRFRHNLRNRITVVYGHRKDSSHSLLKIMPQKTLDRMSLQLTEELETLGRI